MRTSLSALRLVIQRNSISVVAVALLLAGAYYIVAPKMAAQHMRAEGARHNSALLQQQQVAVADTYQFGTPRALSLPRLGVSLDVLPGTYNTRSKTWTLDSSHAFIMSGAQTPATPIIYGHNMRSVFAKLDGVAVDELLRVTMDDGRVLLYRYVDDLVVLPTDSAVLGTGVSHTIFLMTCTGPTFDNRRLLQFQFVGEAQTVTYRESAPHEPLA